eukprot:UC1_evm1s470
MPSVWERLYATGTAASTNKVKQRATKAPQVDRLDFSLRSVYNQHASYGGSRAAAVVQPETRNRVGRVQQKQKREAAERAAMSVKTRKIRPEKPRAFMNTMVEQHHSTKTKFGYARKPCGGFYAR